MTQEWLTQAEIEASVRRRLGEQLSRDIAAYEGSPDDAKKILRGLAAARTMDIDLFPFEDALAERHRVLEAA